MIDPKTGEVIKTIMLDFGMNEIASVDRAAQIPARSVLTKRRGAPGYDPTNVDPKKRGRALIKVLPKPKSGESRQDFISRFMGNADVRKEFPDQAQRAAVANQTFRSARGVSKRLAMTSATEGHAHLVVGIAGSGGSLMEIRAGQTSLSSGSDGRLHSHGWVMDDAGNIIIAEEDGHTHDVDVLIKNESPLEQGSLALMLPDHPYQEEGTMPDKTIDKGAEGKKADSAADNEALKAQNAELTKRAERAEKVAELNDSERTYFKSLKEKSEQDEFLKLDVDGRKVVVDESLAKAADDNPVVFKDPDSGTEYRKKDEPRLIELAKQGAADRKKMREQEAVTKKADLEKRASELKHLPNKDGAVVSLLKAIDALPEKERAPVLAMIKAQDLNMSTLFHKLGTTAPGDDESVGQGEIQKIAKRLKEADPKLSKEQAYAAALETPEGQAAWEADRASQTAAAAS